MDFIIREIIAYLESKGLETFYDVTEEVPEAYTKFGTPIFGMFVFEETEYTYLGTRYKTPRLELPVALVSVSKQNTIVETPLNGRDGTIKEYISTSDYNISLSAILAKQRRYPNDLARIIDQISSAKTSVKISNALLNSLDVFNVVIKSYNVSQVQGKLNLLQLSIEMVSDLTEL